MKAEFYGGPKDGLVLDSIDLMPVMKFPATYDTGLRDYHYNLISFLPDKQMGLYMYDGSHDE